MQLRFSNGDAIKMVFIALLLLLFVTPPESTKLHWENSGHQKKKKEKKRKKSESRTFSFRQFSGFQAATDAVIEAANKP